ncbi:MAG: hypothetical protein IMF09_07865 [Proteobacteria bacterium]|nr:hypothetical protein [Pseudomonadota bacterium]
MPEMEKALLFQIGRKPADLILHMQRIQHHIRSGNRNELFAAIVDLFIVLGARGEGFRKRMLAAGRSVLSDKQFVFLQDNFEFGLDASDGVPWLQGSVLHSGIQGEPVDAWA